MAVKRGERGIVGDGEEAGQDGLAEQPGEGLAFLIAALALPFKPVAQHLMEEDRRSTTGEDRRAAVGLGDGSDA